MCQATARADWLADRGAELLPVPYFHVTFTLPQQIGRLALQNPRQIYIILFQAASETLLTIAADPRHLGASIGFLAVLHTWDQNLHLHPHLHCVVPGGLVSPDGCRWIACRKDSFFLSRKNTPCRRQRCCSPERAQRLVKPNLQRSILTAARQLAAIGTAG
jgi:hypothetical protein